MKPILEIQNLSKRFAISQEQQSYLSIRESIFNVFKQRKRQEEFYALQDVSFNVEEGDTIGIIGKNGAGKSTLLKILSKITPPTSGKIIGRGRIASLLEVGTGFHPELTGRENVLMNGSILGMKRSEIFRNFDEIVDFSGVEKFLDTPLKHYSSGMQLRLAFAVAAFLENEILIVDEVLAVGDAEFQKKCIGKMTDVSKSGRTILFVSHQLGIVTNLCKKTLLLNKGRVHAFDDTSRVIGEYLKLGAGTENRFVAGISKNARSIVISEVYTVNPFSEDQQEEYLFTESVTLKIKLRINEFIPGTHIGVALLDKMETRVLTVVKELINEDVIGTELCITVSLQESVIAPNNYSFTVAAFVPNHKVIDIAENICRIRIVDSGTELSRFEGVDYGSVIIKSNWRL